MEYRQVRRFTAPSFTANQITEEPTPVYELGNQAVLDPYPPPADSQIASQSTQHVYSSVLKDLHGALATLQTDFFSLWLGKYTTAIDWTAAVMSTHVSAALSTLSHSHVHKRSSSSADTPLLDAEAQRVDNEINRYFAQITAYYFGEDHFAIRMQAFDDMLWVVLGWLESISFINAHSAHRYTSRFSSSSYSATGDWHAQQFIPAFAHRARVFYELAEKGWDWRLCGGGMTWNPRLLPYKNAITNQLFIAASASMYLRFPGDRNCEPFIATNTTADGPAPAQDMTDDGCTTSLGDSTPTFKPTYLAAAINGYTWLNASGMRNAAGLYTDGFHISGYRTNHSKTTCDDRNEMVYTYNQGVVLSGLRDLWEATGITAYLHDAHELIKAVVEATGWRNNSKNRHTAAAAAGPLGTNGILHEACDATATCNQDAQSFKGIFFHHLTYFCAPLPRVPLHAGRTYAADRATAARHAQACDEVADWVVWNARAALRTRDARKRFGGAWGVPWSPSSDSSSSPFSSSAVDRADDTDTDGDGDGAESEIHPAETKGAVDYRNHPELLRELDIDVDDATPPSQPPTAAPASDAGKRFAGRDANDRGRGRTVETQGSGLAVVRAMWEFLRWWREAGL
jgi:hypothetical protein